MQEENLDTEAKAEKQAVSPRWAIFTIAMALAAGLATGGVYAYENGLILQDAKAATSSGYVCPMSVTAASSEAEATPACCATEVTAEAASSEAEAVDACCATEATAEAASSEAEAVDACCATDAKAASSEAEAPSCTSGS